MAKGAASAAQDTPEERLMAGTRTAAVINARCDALLHMSLMPLLLLSNMAGR